MNKYTFILLLFVCPSTYAQTKVINKKKTHYTVNITATPQLYLNAGNVENDGIAPEAVSTHNTAGFTMGVEMERKSKSGFILNFATQYGWQYHSVRVGYESISFFDPSVAPLLNALGPVTYDIKGATAYINFRLMAGYVIPYKILNGWHVELKAGVSQRFYINGFQKETDLSILLQKNDSLFSSNVISGNFMFGGKVHGWEASWGQAAEFYIGLCKDLNYKVLRNVNVGFEITRGFNNDYRGASGSGYVNAMNLYKQTDWVSTDKYVAKDFSIGLRLAVGLGPK